mmetsp:Transcript_22764/g.42310  ORF Transcript_22764/g.42310 Transcript_22764/m.42310 type:complete len:160 (-) Transcript_22764:65-544(-)|eukprot:CAMPEP_0178748618 /NCGR_PEP_ID=MMETSP0744-20121128/8976_1 /TAXON_ID=913974 /ORGANISM="Nitzschia punctata, Strain CCMP561" /LENGTH=159 /DNA_ID=CAMNT_0020401983 /DNA_START=31 /DNA_END=510 /DNA_ORIENTATION=-
MATRGVFQCKKLTLFYCEHGGSSRAVREYLGSKRLWKWAQDRPSVEIAVKVRNGKHPFVKAEYLTAPLASGKKPDGGPVVHQICVKSKQPRNNNGSDGDPYVDMIEETLTKLYNRSGRKLTKFKQPVYTQTPSIQGVWTPSLNLHLQEPSTKFDLKIIE